jgi:hypothetical protein
MDSISQVAVEIASQVAPDEIYNAPLIMKNFARGGKTRKDLLRHDNADEPGAFGIGDATLLAWIFHSLTVASPYLIGFLAARTQDNAGIILRAILSALNVQSPTARNSAQLHEPIPLAPKQLEQIVDIMANALQKAELSTQESRTVAYKVIQVLWEDTPNAIVFLNKIAEKK